VELRAVRVGKVGANVGAVVGADVVGADVGGSVIHSFQILRTNVINGGMSKPPFPPGDGNTSSEPSSGDVADCQATVLPVQRPPSTC
jgi:hypothetical protein